MRNETRILLVEDDPEDYALTLELIDEIDEDRFRVDWANSYESGLEALAACEHQVCLLDYQLGAHTGIDFLRAAGELRHTVPIILLTGQGSGVLEKDALTAGAADYLVKDATKRDDLSRALRHARERSRAVEALRQRDLVFRAVFDGALDAMLITNDAGRYVDANPAACRMFGLDRGTLLTRSVHDLVVAPLEETRASFSRFRDEGRDEGVIHIRRGDGTIRVAEYNATANIQPGRHLSVLRDVTERRRAEEARQRLASIVESASDAIIGITAEWKISSWNRAAEELYGYARGEVLGADWPARLAAPDRMGELMELRQRLEAGESIRDFRTVCRRKDGSVFDGSVTLSLLRDDQGRVAGAAALLRDLTEDNRLRARLAVADNMASLGRLAAGVAHEINNPLAAVISNLAIIDELAGHVADEPARVREIEECLSDAMSAADRVRHIVRDLRLFSRPVEDRRQAVDVRMTLETTLRMASNELRHRARVVKDYAPTPLIDANEGRLGQVFMNLLINAAHAISEGNVDGNEIRIATRTERDRVKVSISDTGVGIAEDALERIFEPFYTTKPMGIGTGLGLSICHGIVTSLGGEITVSSNRGRGTTFEVSLPIGEPRVAGPASSSEGPRKGRRARVLVVDDELPLVKSTIRLLSAHHDVSGTSDPHEALARIRAGESFDAIICDLMMPKMAGSDLYCEIRRVVPSLAQRIVFATGGAFTPDAVTFLDEVKNPVLEKPFERAALLDLIRQVVEKAT